MLASLAALVAATALSIDCPPPPAVNGAVVPESLAERLGGPPPVFLQEVPGGEARWQTLRDLYAARGHAPLWADRPSALEAAWAQICASAHAGLWPDHYLPGPGTEEAVVEAALLAELRITDALAAFGRHLAHGRVRVPRWQVDGAKVDEAAFIDALGAALASPDPARRLAKLAPQNGAYRQMSDAIRHYREIAADGGWPAIPPGRILREGDRDPRVPSLRARLALTGDLPPSAVVAVDLYDAAVAEGVRHFQARHGLEVDGALGPKTREALSVPVEDRLRQMILNLERLRWLGDVDLGARHVWVNVPAFEVKLVEDGRSVARMRAVMGRHDRQTPIFSDRIEYLEVNPSWWVPASIVEARIIPRASEDPDWLRRMGYELRRQGRSIDPAEVDWSKARQEGRLPYAVRQRPGPANAMGQVKFMFPNRHMVYLHDTPERALFDRPVRAFSFGCVRVAEPDTLARFLLEGHAEEKREVLEAALEGKSRRQPERIELEEPVPVHIVYLTAWVDEDGALRFRDDVYYRDGRLARRLDRAWPGWDE